MVNKTERLSIRLTAEQDILLHRAAEAAGESTNAYVLRNAVGAAQADLADLRVFLVDEIIWSEIESSLSKPVKFNSEMMKLLTNSTLLEK